jgi:hypothetical protein
LLELVKLQALEQLEEDIHKTVRDIPETGHGFERKILGSLAEIFESRAMTFYCGMNRSFETRRGTIMVPKRDGNLLSPKTMKQDQTALEELVANSKSKKELFAKKSDAVEFCEAVFRQ